MKTNLLSEQFKRELLLNYIKCEINKSKTMHGKRMRKMRYLSQICDSLNINSYELDIGKLTMEQLDRAKEAVRWKN